MYTPLRGQQFGRLFPLRKIGVKHDCALWLCGCACGNYAEITIGQLKRKSGPQRTCGQCYDHLRYPKEYITWRNMKRRCHDPLDKDYKNYGAKGIIVNDKWRYNFLEFLIYIGLAPTLEHTLDRIDSTLPYQPGNVRWATRELQNLNRSTTHTPIAKMRLAHLLEKYSTNSNNIT